MTHEFCDFLFLSGGGGDVDAGWAGAGFCCLLCLKKIMYNKIFNSIKTKGPSSDLSVALDVFLSSLKCEMHGTSQGRRGLYGVIWILILDPDYRDPQKQSVLAGMVGNMLPAWLFVFTACLLEV